MHYILYEDAIYTMLFLWALVAIILIFMWVFFLPIFIVGFMCSVPFFVFALPISLGIGTCIYFAVDQIKESTLRDIISSAPVHKWFGEIKVNIPEGNHLICCHPHGMICTSAIFGIHLRPGSKTLIAVAPIVFAVPVIGWIAKHMGAIPATYISIKKGLQNGPVILLPGGVPEIVTGTHYKKRWGFLRIIRDMDKQIIKVINKETYYNTVNIPLYDLRRFIAEKYNVPIVFPWLFGWYGTWIPMPKPIKPDISIFKYNHRGDLEINRETYYSF